MGAKTMIALSIIFWVPVSALAGILFYMFEGLLQDETTNRMQAHIAGVQGVYAERLTTLSELLEQLKRHPEVRRSFLEKDSEKLQSVLLDFGKQYSFVSILVAVDENQRIIGRRHNGRTGEVFNIGDLLPNALVAGVPSRSTELVSDSLLRQENDELAGLNGIGIVQFAVSPVSNGEKVIGALIGGILLTGDPWMGNTVYNRFGVNMALFAGNSQDSAVLHSAASVPRSHWAMGQPMPQKLKEEIALGRAYAGPLVIADTLNTVAYEPIKDSRNRIIGTFGVSMDTDHEEQVVAHTIAKGAFIAAMIGLVISVVLTYFVRSDITKPLKLLVRAMHRFGNGDMDISVDLKTGDEFEQLGKCFNHMAQGIRKREERLKKHNTVSKHLMSTLKLEELMDQTLSIVVDVTESQIGVIYLLNKDEQILVPFAQYGTHAELENLKVGEGYPGQAVKERKPIFLAPTPGVADMMIELGFALCAPKEIAYIPLMFHGNVLGVLTLGSMDKYSEDEIQLFDYLADQISIALDNAIMHQRVQELSITDGLTGLHNRRFLNERLEAEWARSVRHSQPISILLSDVDNFKSVNDTYGHDKGDEVLVRIADVFKKNTRKEDLVARYGGEEFVAVLFDTTADEAMQLANRICMAARRQTYPWMDRKATLSIGCATCAKVESSSFEELIQAADQAMYQAKSTGKDKVVVAKIPVS